MLTGLEPRIVQCWSPSGGINCSNGRGQFGLANLRFEEACALARAFGFHLSLVSGSHHVFVHQSVRELVNLQDVRGKAKPYQVKQLLAVAERYNLPLGGEE